MPPPRPILTQSLASYRSLAAVLISTASTWAVCVAAADEIDFAADVRPILAAYCFDCHGRETLDGGIGLETYYHSQRPTDSGAMLITPGDADQSALLRAITSSDADHRMPLGGEPLSKANIQTIRDWIDGGGQWPDDGWRPPRHWAFEPPQRVAPPLKETSEVTARNGNEIDLFIAAEQAKRGLSLGAAAEPAQLLRRVYLDLVGMPPPAEEVIAWESDPAFDRYERIVDRLLASPAFGEKWAVQWLDLARYADSEGYQRDSPRSMWPYRDWVIEAINADMPFDQFTLEQFAGDLLPDPTESQLIATAFHRNAATNLEAGTDPHEDRFKVIVDRVNTTGTIWLGLTIGCAQCHNHKYDPISAREYYELFAFFDSLPMETRQQGEAMGMSNLEHIGPSLQVALTAADERDIRLAEADYRQRLDVIERKLRRAATKPSDGDATAEIDAVNSFRKAIDSGDWIAAAEVQRVAKKVAGGKKPQLQQLISQLEIVADRLEERRQKSVRVMADDRSPRPTYVAIRGDFLARGDRVYPATPAALHPFDDGWPRNRLGLAKWLTAPGNPLVGRAFVNRLWIEIFGEGLVTTPEDFGAAGTPANHRQLLDWLAATFVGQDQWSLKRMLRRVVLSATYRQSVALREACEQIDPLNTNLWRHPGHRLKAEQIRDVALTVSGLLDRRMGGYHVRPFQPPTFWRRTAGAGETYYLPSTGSDAYRRGIYTQWRRNAHYPSFANFDAPDRSICRVQRDVSNTPMQALTLLNDPVYVELAEAFADRIVREGGETPEQRLVWAFRSVVARSPSDRELAILRDLLVSSGDAVDAAEGYREVATVLFNLHEAINRN